MHSCITGDKLIDKIYNLYLSITDILENIMGFITRAPKTDSGTYICSNWVQILNDILIIAVIYSLLILALLAINKFIKIKYLTKDNIKIGYKTLVLLFISLTVAYNLRDISWKVFWFPEYFCGSIYDKVTNATYSSEFVHWYPEYVIIYGEILTCVLYSLVFLVLYKLIRCKIKKLNNWATNINKPCINLLIFIGLFTTLNHLIDIWEYLK